MKNNNGMTLVEFITSFTLASIIIVLLLNVILILRDVYNKSNIKSDIIIEQSSLSNQLNKEFVKNNLISYSINNSDNYSFVFTDDIYNLVVNRTEYTIKFGKYTYKFPEGTKIGNPSIDIKTFSVYSGNDSIFILNIPITNNKFPDENFDVNIVYMYNSNALNL